MMRSYPGMLSVISLQFGLIFLSGLAWAGLVGQQGTCGAEPKKTVVALTGQEKVVDLAEGLKTEAWTFSGITPGPTIEVCEGDTVRIVLKNEGAVAHGLDSHAHQCRQVWTGRVGENARL